MITVLVKNSDGIILPEYKTLESAGCDIRAKLDESLMLFPNQRKIIPTGLFCNIPKGYEIQIRPRSGLAIDYGITVLNSPGTINNNEIQKNYR